MFIKVLTILLVVTQNSFPKVQVLSPAKQIEQIKDQTDKIGSIEYSVAMFGNISYGENFLVEVQATPTEFGCETLPVSKEEEQTDEKLTKIAYIMSRGECTFSMKTHNVFQSGADVALVYNNIPNMKASHIVPVSDQKYKHEPLPMVLISKEDGEKILETLKTKKVYQSIKFDHPGSMVAKPVVEMHVSVEDEQSYRLLLDLKGYLDILDDKVVYELKYKFKSYMAEVIQSMHIKSSDAQSYYANKVINNTKEAGESGGSCTCPDGEVYLVGDQNNDCKSLACFDGGVSGECHKTKGEWSHRKVTCGQKIPKIVEHSCYSNGKYCIGTENGEIAKPLELINEGVRQICIYNKDMDLQKAKWWGYIKAYRQICLKDIYKKYFSADECFYEIAKPLRIDTQQINDCVEKSFVPWVNNEQKWGRQQDRNTLQEDSIDMSNPFLFMVPKVMINSQMFRGNMKAVNVANWICSFFEKRPEECRKIEEMTKENPNPLVEYRNDSFHDDVVLLIVLFAMIGFVLTLACMKQAKRYFGDRARLEVGDLVSSAVGDYMRIIDQESGET